MADGPEAAGVPSSAQFPRIVRARSICLRELTMATISPSNGRLNEVDSAL